MPVTASSDTSPGESEQDRHADRRADRRDQQRIGDDAGLGLLRIGEQLRQSAPQAQRGDLRGEFDGQHGIGEAPERGRRHRSGRR